MAITLTEIDAQINALIADPVSMTDYRVGDKQFSNSGKLTQLLALRKSLFEVQEVALDVVQFDCAIDMAGTDDTQHTIL